MRTIILGERPVEIERLIAQRKAAGADTHDELWEGVLHMAPAPNQMHALVALELLAALRPGAKRAGLFATTEFNLGDQHDFRVPDGGLHRERTGKTWLATAALVVEVISPGDESWAKLPFYAAHAVDEVVIADPSAGDLVWLALTGQVYEPVLHSRLLDVAVADIDRSIDWPPAAPAIDPAADAS